MSDPFDSIFVDTSMGLPDYMPVLPIMMPGESAGGVVPIAPDPAGEYVAGNAATPDGEYHTLNEQPSDIAGVLSQAVYRAILRDPTAKPAFATLKAAVLSGGLKITPAVKARPDATEADPEADLAQEIADFCQRCCDRLDEHPLIFLDEMLDSLVYRHKVAEVVMEQSAGGPDAGRYVLDRLPRKPRWSYRFRVDSKNNVGYLRCLVDGEGEESGRLVWRDIPRWKFAIAAWSCEDGDPRGNSILDAAAEAWKFKRNLLPNWWKGLKQFGSPSLFGTTHEGAEDIPQKDEQGNPKPPLNPQKAMKGGLEAFFRSGSVIVGPYGSNIKVIESNKDGTTNEKAVERCDRDITRAILLQTRATGEARFGSKADSQTGQDIMEVYVQFIRLWACSLFDAQVLYPVVEANWGEAVAERLTPNVSLGQVSLADFAKAASAVATLFQSSYFTEGQLSETDAILGLPVRQAGDSRVGPQQSAANADPAQADAPPPNDGAAA